MIEEARQRSTEAVRRRREAILREPLAGLRLCPLCGREVTAPPIEDTGVFQCGACGGFFFDRGGTGEIRLETRGRRGATRREALRVRER